MEIGKLKKAGQDTSELQAKVRAMGERSAQLEEQVKAIDEDFRQRLSSIEPAARERAGGRQRRR